MNAKEEIIRQPKISVQHRISWNSVSIADFVGDILYIKKRNDGFLYGISWKTWFVYLKKLSVRNGNMQASSSNGRASDSKSGCWGFESLLACQKNKKGEYILSL